MKIWFTADTHFGQERTLKMSRRPFKDVSEMNTVMIKNWNSLVAPEDTVYHLGDFGDYEVSKQLNGNIILLFGNYERDDVKKGEVTFNDLQTKYNFKEVHNSRQLFIQEPFDCVLIHEPSNKIPSGFHLFGHIHRLQMVRKYGLNVGVDCHEYKPIDVETIDFYKNAIANHYDKEVFE